MEEIKAGFRKAVLINVAHNVCKNCDYTAHDHMMVWLDGDGESSLVLTSDTGEWPAEGDLIIVEATDYFATINGRREREVDRLWKVVS